LRVKEKLGTIFFTYGHLIVITVWTIILSTYSYLWPFIKQIGSLFVCWMETCNKKNSTIRLQSRYGSTLPHLIIL